MKIQVYLYTLCGTLLYPCSSRLDTENPAQSKNIITLTSEFCFVWVRVLSWKCDWPGIHHTTQTGLKHSVTLLHTFQRLGIIGVYHLTCLAVASSNWIGFAVKMQKQWCCAFLSLKVRDPAHFNSITLLALCQLSTWHNHMSEASLDQTGSS